MNFLYDVIISQRFGVSIELNLTELELAMSIIIAEIKLECTCLAGWYLKFPEDECLTIPLGFNNCHLLPLLFFFIKLRDGDFLRSTISTTS